MTLLVAEHEAEMISTRTKAALTAAKVLGNQWNPTAVRTTIPLESLGVGRKQIASEAHPVQIFQFENT